MLRATDGTDRKLKIIKVKDSGKENRDDGKKNSYRYVSERGHWIFNRLFWKTRLRDVPFDR